MQTNSSQEQTKSFRIFPVKTVCNHGEPRWNSASQCIYKYFNANHKDFPRCRISIELWSQKFVSSLHPLCRKLFKLYIKYLPQAEDDDGSKSIYYIDRFLLLSQSAMCTNNNFIIRKYNKKVPHFKECFEFNQIIRLFLLEGRVYTKWKRETWNNIRGKVALENRWSYFWNNDVLTRARVEYLSNKKKSSYHSLGLEPADLEATKQVIAYKETKAKQQQEKQGIASQAVILSIGEWNERKFYTLCCNGIYWCPALIWLLFNFPKTTPVLSDTSLYRDGILRFGTLSNLTSKLKQSLLFSPKLEVFSKENEILCQLYNQYKQTVWLCFYQCNFFFRMYWKCLFYFNNVIFL